MLICSMSVSIDGFISDRDGDFNWTPVEDERFRYSLTEVQGLGAYLLGRRLYEAMRVWETDPEISSSATAAPRPDVSLLRAGAVVAVLVSLGGEECWRRRKGAR
jgi:dihydrofolate reductase